MKNAILQHHLPTAPAVPAVACPGTPFAPHSPFALLPFAFSADAGRSIHSASHSCENGAASESLIELLIKSLRAFECACSMQAAGRHEFERRRKADVMREARMGLAIPSHRLHYTSSFYCTACNAMHTHIVRPSLSGDELSLPFEEIRFSITDLLCSPIFAEMTCMQKDNAIGM